ncbi:hypothetical protein DVH24_034097, partial [Malus domestica]
ISTTRKDYKSILCQRQPIPPTQSSKPILAQNHPEPGGRRYEGSLGIKVGVLEEPSSRNPNTTSI